MKKSKKFKKNLTEKNGIALLLTVLIVSVVMLTATSIVDIVIIQLKLSSDINKSVVAVYAADSGVEWQLYQVRNSISVSAPVMSNGATISTTLSVTPPNFIIKSLGSYQAIKRQFEVSF